MPAVKRSSKKHSRRTSKAKTSGKTKGRKMSKRSTKRSLKGGAKRMSKRRVSKKTKRTQKGGNPDEPFRERANALVGSRPVDPNTLYDKTKNPYIPSSNSRSGETLMPGDKRILTTGKDHIIASNK